MQLLKGILAQSTSWVKLWYAPFYLLVVVLALHTAVAVPDFELIGICRNQLDSIAVVEPVATNYQWVLAVPFATFVLCVPISMFGGLYGSDTAYRASVWGMRALCVLIWSSCLYLAIGIADTSSVALLQRWIVDGSTFDRLCVLGAILYVGGVLDNWLRITFYSSSSVEQLSV